MPQKLAPCGTPAAYVRHLYRGEPVDEACREANAAAKRGQGHTRVRNRAQAELIRRHRPEYLELAHAGTGPNRWNRARSELTRRYPEEFRRLLTDEFTKQALEES